MLTYESCTLCPRRCGIDRRTERGFCQSGVMPKIARAALHYWEEPCISGTKGSGTIFFSGCNLRCVYCQNRDISSGGFGKEISSERLAEIFKDLEVKGAHNINLVTPTHFVPSITAALDLYRPKIPVIYNCGGYENLETIDALKGYVDIYLTDIKYLNGEYSLRYSGAADYFPRAYAAAKGMIDQIGAPEFKDGLMTRGVIIRHLCLPSLRKDSIALIEQLAKLPKGSFVLSLMSQYTPAGDANKYPEINRRITTFEYNSVVDRAISLGLTNGYTQDRRSAKEEYTPPFDLEGVSFEK